MARKSSSSGSSRSSSSRRKPVTIDLEAETVARTEGDPAKAESSETRESAAGSSGGSAKGTAAGNIAKTEKSSAKTNAPEPDKTPGRKPENAEKGAAEGKPSKSGAPSGASGKSGAAAGAKADKVAETAAAKQKAAAGAPGKASETGKSAQSGPAGRPAAAAQKTIEDRKGAPGRRETRSSLPFIAAALIGGIVTLAGGVALDRAGIIRLGQDRSMEADALAKLEAGVAELSGALEGLRTDIETKIDAFSASVGESGSLQEQIEGLKSQLSGLSGVELPDLEPLQNRLGELETQVKNWVAENVAVDGDSAALKALESRLAGAVSEIGSIGKTLASVVESSRTRGESIVAAEERLAGQIASLQAALTELEARTDEAAARADAAATAESVKQAIEASANAARKAEQAVAIAPVLAAQALQRAVTTGAPLESALNAFANLGFKDPALDELSHYAKSGLPTMAGLRAEFEALAERLNAAPAEAGPGEEQAGAVDRLLKGAFGVVKVRPVAPQEGDGSLAVRSRIAAALAEGDVDWALTEWQTLPEDQQAAGGEWARKARAVQLALQFADRVRADALARLNMTQ